MKNILTAREWEKLQKIPDEMKIGKYAYILPEDLDKLGYLVDD